MIAIEAQLARACVFLASIAGAAERAMARTLNKAAVAGRESAVRSITDRYSVAAGDVREKMSLSSATSEHLSVSVVAKSGSLALGAFPHSPTEAGTGGPGRPALTAEVVRSQSKAVPGAFIATIGGKPRIMIRSGGATKTGRTKIKSLYGPPIAIMLGAESVREDVERRAEAVIGDQLNREIDRALRKSA